jgi:hypothetical protein
MQGCFGTTLPVRGATVLLAGLFLVAPHKFGNIVNPVGPVGGSVFPTSTIEWIVGMWPTYFPAIASGVALLTVLLAHWWRRRPDYVRAWPLLLPCLLLALATLIGMPHTTERYVAMFFLAHMFGVLAFLLAVYIHLTQVPESRHLFLGAAVVGVLTSALNGWYGKLQGQAEMIQFLYDMEANGETIIMPLWERVLEGRITASFTYPNVFAAHLLLLLPVTLYVVDRWAKFLQPNDIQADVTRVTRPLFVGTSAILMLVAVYWTGSRAAVLGISSAAMVMTGMVAITHRDWLRRRRQLLVAPAVIVLVAGIVISLQFYDRGLSSLGARLDYADSAVQMFAEHPATGVGVGEFFPNYMRLKGPGAEETRLPHNLLLYFLSQCGIFGGLAGLLFIVQPVMLWFRRIGDGPPAPLAFGCVVAGMLAWSAHALADFDLHVPATMMMVVTLPLLVLKLPGAVPGGLRWHRSLCMLAALACLANLLWIPGDMAHQDLQLAMDSQQRLTQQSPPVRAPRPGALLPLVERAGKLIPWSPYPYDSFGKHAFQFREYALAREAFMAAAERAPHRSSVYKQIADCSINLGELEIAREYLEKALLWYPHDPQLSSRIKSLEIIEAKQAPP